MKTYAEEKGEKPFDWNAALDDAINAEPDEDLFRDLLIRSVGWVTCACGNQCSELPRHADGSPSDSNLNGLGCEFSRAVVSHEWVSAKRILANIEKRSAELLADK